MEATINGFKRGTYTDENRRWLAQNLGKRLKCERYNMNYVLFTNGFLCHVYECSIHQQLHSAEKPKIYNFGSTAEVDDFHTELSSLIKTDWFKLGEISNNSVSYSFYVYDLVGNAIMFAAHYY